MSAILAHVDLVPSLLISEPDVDLVNLARVRLEGTSLREALVTFGAFERADTYNTKE